MKEEGWRKAEVEGTDDSTDHGCDRNVGSDFIVLFSKASNYDPYHNSIRVTSPIC
jgi:hypothetical protein